MMNTLPLIAIPMGDAAGIGPEIIAKALGKNELHTWVRPLIIGHQETLAKAMEITAVPLKIKVIETPDQGDYQKDTLNLIDLANLDFSTLTYGKVQAQTGKAAYEYIAYAIQLALNNDVAGIATTPINKESLRAAQIPYIGHTEIFAELTQTKNPLTMFQVHDLKIFFYSRHVSLREACDLINQTDMEVFITRCHDVLKLLGFKEPKLAVAGLNPHSGEHGLFGMEEVNHITPAIKAIQETTDIDVVGPIGADSIFHQGRIGKYDAVLALYHDQGHIAAKTFDFDRTISLTNNMPFLRTSVDHGTAFDIAGTGQASAISMIEAIRLASQYSPHYRK